LSAEVDELQAENGRLAASVQQMEESVLKWVLLLFSSRSRFCGVAAIAVCCSTRYYSFLLSMQH
jgi:hypothetical protein